MMKKMLPLFVTTIGVALLFAGVGFAAVSAPPVFQGIGMLDASIGAMAEADCRICHSSGIPDRHHLLYGATIPSSSLVPYPDGDGDGNPDTNYGCLNCHDENFNIVRDCTVCHNTTSPHHQTASAAAGDCVACHGDVVDNMNDVHYIPTYAPSLITPKPSGGAGEPLNSRGNGAGACNYCHDADTETPPVILTNFNLHHGTNLVDFGLKCLWCHQALSPIPKDAYDIRTCEGCHGPDSLHNIQADSPNPSNVGTLVVGGEDAGYGHVGRDAGPGDSDCWGCHGFDTTPAASAPGSGPIRPSIDTVDPTVTFTKTLNLFTITGSGFTNTAGGTEYTSILRLTNADGNTIYPEPVTISEGELTFILWLPNSYAGNYTIQVVKEGNASDAVGFTVKPLVEITDTTCTECEGIITIDGSGFGDTAPAGTEDYINVMMDAGVELEIISWSDTQISVSGSCDAESITVNALFGSATSQQ